MSRVSQMGKSHVDGLIVIQDAMLNANPRLIAEHAAKQRLPSVGFEEFAEGGGLVGFGADLREMYGHAAYFIDKILKGAKPSEIPVGQPTRFELVVNAKTARALILTLPPALLTRGRTASIS